MPSPGATLESVGPGPMKRYPSCSAFPQTAPRPPLCFSQVLVKLDPATRDPTEAPVCLRLPAHSSQLPEITSQRTSGTPVLESASALGRARTKTSMQTFGTMAFGSMKYSGRRGEEQALRAQTLVLGGSGGASVPMSTKWVFAKAPVPLPLPGPVALQRQS